MSLLDRAVSQTRLNRSAPRRVCPADLDATLPLAPERPQEVRETLPMKCLYCQAPVERSTTEVHVQRKGYNLSWKNLPAWVCTRCDRPYFEPREVEIVGQALSSMIRLKPAS